MFLLSAGITVLLFKQNLYILSVKDGTQIYPTFNSLPISFDNISHATYDEKNKRLYIASRIDYKEHKATTVQQVDLIPNERTMLFDLPVEQVRYPFQDAAPMQVKNIIYQTEYKKYTDLHFLTNENATTLGISYPKRFKKHILESFSILKSQN